MAQSSLSLLGDVSKNQTSPRGCPLCNGSVVHTECMARDELRNEGECLYRYVRCFSCQTLYLDPLPTGVPLSELYDSGYHIWNKNSLKLFFHYLFLDLPQVRTVQKFKKGGSLLDIGCGMGTFLACVRKNTNWKIEGIEPSSYGCESAFEKLGLSVRQTTLEDAPFAARSFDVITLWDVLEHVENPRSTLKKVHRLLKEDGVVLISMPNIGSVDYPLFKERWYYLAAPYHFSLFSPSGVRRLLREEGFDPLLFRTTFLSLYDSVFCSFQWVLRKGENIPRTPFQKMRRNFISFTGIFIGVLLCLVMSPIFFMAHLFQRGSRLVVAARKTPGEDS